ncbi:MAG: ATP-binding protein [Methylacidiphilales bacterium]|nr:ATP-binding protein [Candidatus Methylacidiphilales bacterium]
MKSRQDASLQIRLAGIAIVGLFLAMAAIAYFSGQQVQRGSDLIVTDTVPGTIAAHKMRMAMSRGIGWVMVAASAQTAQSRDASLKIAHDSDLAFASAVEQYHATIKINPGEDRALLDRVTSQYEEYRRQRLTYESLIVAGDRNGSAAFLENSLVPAYVAVIGSAEALLKYNHENSIIYANYMHNSIHHLYWGEAVVIVLAAISAVVLIVNFAIRRDEVRKLRENEEKFSKAFRSNPSGIAITKMETGEYLEVNESFCRITGYSPQELIGHNAVELGLWSAAADRNQAKSLLAGETLRDLELQARMRDGGSKTVLINTELIELDGEQRIVSLVQDITERKRVQEDLRATNERYSRQEAALMELTRVCALRRDGAADIRREVTQIAARTLGVERVSIWCYERDNQGIACQALFELSPGSYSSGAVLRAADFPSYFRALGDGAVIAAHDANRDPRTAELSETYLRPNGISSMLDSPIHVIGSVAGVVCCEHAGPARQWTADEQTFAIAIANVVSLFFTEGKRQEIEEQFRQSQKMEGIGQLAGGVAHDFNNILAVIEMQSALLKRSGSLSSEQAEFADEISITVKRAAALTRQLLLFSRREVFQPSDVDLNESVTSTAKMLNRILAENVRMQIKLSSEPMLVHADAGMMDQILLNLAVNARDAMPDGGQLVIETSGVEFDDFAVAQSPQARTGSFVCLNVSDSGCGIPREILPRIFEPFFTTKDVGKGTGLGLATVFGIVQQHQGWINVYSEVNHGTSFRVYLPQLPENGGAKSLQSALTITSGGHETILLVEDDPSLRVSVRKALSQLGYRILEAPTGVKALEVWKANHEEIRLLLTDLVMPDGMSGKNLAQSILLENPKLQVIYMSGYSAEVVGKDFPLKEGANFLTKPFEAQKLAQIVRERLDAAEAPKPRT